MLADDTAFVTHAPAYAGYCHPLCTQIEGLLPADQHKDDESDASAIPWK